ncbi:DMT family transporter [Clostridium perfringens]|uniref:DMT family transporter n=1 Tax=Clostridium perfringens TaxID=1502 RepID=UPI001A1C8A86|nr:DMT family transporter [Clostridium perfringens]MDU5882272.1 DMT family transporter [Clostridium perfringens]UBK70189.1 DMT family transporter [Clostridium perfringens]UBK72737.1 DMT family transporter [Clostridium perfringens]HAT4133574.1 DMT family transporter [Clostridium perfringens]HAT4143678.1 DMT family transporter [Clostridium perfringens]
MNNKTKGIILITISALSFALMSTFVKLSGDLPSIEKSFFRNLVSCFVAFYLVKKDNAVLFGQKENRLALIGRSALGTLGIWANYYAIDRLILSDATILNKLSPFFVIIFSYLFLKEKLKPIHIICLLAAFSGVLFIVRPSGNLASNFIPAIIGLCSAAFAGGAYTFVRYLGGKEKGATIVFFFSFFSIVTTFPIMLFQFETFGLEQFVFLILAGVAASCAQFALTAAYKYAPARDISIYDYTQVIFTALIGFVLFGDIPDKISLIGYALILLASFSIFLYNKKEANK